MSTAFLVFYMHLTLVSLARVPNINSFGEGSAGVCCSWQLIVSPVFDSIRGRCTIDWALLLEVGLYGYPDNRHRRQDVVTY